jgi:hypothetical protein
MTVLSLSSRLPPWTLFVHVVSRRRPLPLLLLLFLSEVCLLEDILLLAVLPPKGWCDLEYHNNNNINRADCWSYCFYYCLSIFMCLLISLVNSGSPREMSKTYVSSRLGTWSMFHVKLSAKTLQILICLSCSLSCILYYCNLTRLWLGSVTFYI